jgi:hypothetical protein
MMSVAIKIGDKVRSFDFESRDLTGSRAAFIEGNVVGFLVIEGCTRYEIAVSSRVFRGLSEAISTAKVYPPLNGTRKLFGGVTNGVERIGP